MSVSTLQELVSPSLFTLHSPSTSSPPSTPPPTLSPVERELDERLAESFQRAAGGGHVVGPIIREPLEAIYHVISSQHTTNPTILSSLGESWILDEWLVVGGVGGW